MKEIRFTLVSDGSSDRALLPILRWALTDIAADYAVQDAWAGPWKKRATTQAEAIRKTVELYPCDLLFVHGDAEREDRHCRAMKIRRIIAQSGVAPLPIVCVIPVRMTEAWLLTDEVAIRYAAGNPSGCVKLEMPADAEALPNPKGVLYDLLVAASELQGRRRKKFCPGVSAIRITQSMDDFSKLRGLSAYRAFEAELRAVLAENGYLSSLALEGHSPTDQ